MNNALYASSANRADLRFESFADTADPLAGNAEDENEIYVVFTPEQNSLEALAAAKRLANGCHSPIVVLVLQLVPFPLPLDEPHVAPEFTARRVQKLVHDAGVAAEVRICLCRQPEHIVNQLARPSTVLVSGRFRWWRSVESRLVNALSTAGHHVVVANRK